MEGRQVRLRVTKVQDRALQQRLIYSNRCAVSSLDFPRPRDPNALHYILIRGGQPAGEYVVVAEPHDNFPRGCISLSDPQRSWARIGMMDQFLGEIYDPFSRGRQAYIASIDIDIDFASASKRSNVEYKEADLIQQFLGSFQNQILAPAQRIIMDVANVPLMAVVRGISLSDLGSSEKPDETPTLADPNARGILTSQAEVSFFKAGGSSINLKASGTSKAATPIFISGLNFKDLGIGGLDKEIGTIFRRAFASRLVPRSQFERFGLTHVKGLLLYGPPGTGKTLIARKIGMMLNGREPKVINGPEVLNKFVGQSEENIRKIFAEAEKEQAELGDDSGLHVIIFDELDAVCKQRGSTGGGTGVGDSVVNQLLTKLDGVNPLNNILMIGMTNRKDMIDEALLRPGRLEVHVEISLPDTKGRLDIFNIHTKQARTNDGLDASVDLEALAESTKNYSGSEIQGVVRAAETLMFSRHSKFDEGEAKIKLQPNSELRVTMEDFREALKDVRPAFGVSEDIFKIAIPMGMLEYNDSIRSIIRRGLKNVDAVNKSRVNNTRSITFYGPPGSGKTALAAHIAELSNYPFVKMISPQALSTAANPHDYVRKVFSDAFKSSHSIIIVDAFERLIEWNPMGERYNSTICNLLITMIQSQPPEGRRFLVFVTTSQFNVLQGMGIADSFDHKMAVPAIRDRQTLQQVLVEEGTLKPQEIGRVLDTVDERLHLGIKPVLKAFDQARLEFPEGGPDMVDEFASMLVENNMRQG